jgi:hypothetical protein
MRDRHWLKNVITRCGVIGVLLCGSEGKAELKPGEVLDKATWQEAKDAMPEAILRRFASGQHLSKVITLPPEALQYGSRFRQLTEANEGKYGVNDRGVLIETSTGTWPQYRPGGFPFPVVDQNDSQAAYKIIYNFASRGGPVDDIDLLLNIFWVSDKSLNRSVDFAVKILSYGSRWSGPIVNPDEVAGKSLGYGIAPYDVVGIATLGWGYLDPDKWDSRWAYIPVIRRVRRLAASNTSDGFLGSHWSPSDYGLFAGKVQYFTWKLIGSREALVPYTLPTPKYWEKSERGLVLPADENVAIMPWPGNNKKFTASGQQWSGAAWWPVNLHMAKRPVWIIEITAKDPYFAYGRQILWVDKDLYRAYYKEVYDRAGEYWKTFLLAGGIALSRDNVFSTPQSDYGVAIDEHHGEANVVLPLREGNDIRVNVGLEDGLFSYQGLSRLGK